MTQLFSAGAKQSVVVTGGNQGLGFACAAALALSSQNWCVIIAGHDRERIAAAADELRQRGARRVEPMLLNLASLRSIHYFSENLAEEVRLGHLPPLHALVCNAAVQIPYGISYTTDGFEQTFGVNFLGHFMLINALLPQLTEPARIILTAGGTGHLWRPMDLGPLPTPPAISHVAWPERMGGLRLSGLARYRLSKQYKVLIAHELHRRLAADHLTGARDIAVNVYFPSPTPGTQLARHWPGWVRRFWRSKALSTLVRAGGAHIPTVEQSGRALASLVMDPALQGLSGRYFQGFIELRSTEIITNPAVSQKWWEDCSELLRGQSLGETRQPLTLPKSLILS